jgi:hypothetical protein
MHPISAQDMLQVWERGASRAPIARALLLLSAADPGSSWDALAALPVGRRDGLLLTLRRWAFGEKMVSVAECPDCGESLEVSFSVTDVRADSPDLPSDESPIHATIDGYEIAFRLPTSADVARAVSAADPRAALLDGCVASAMRNGRDVAAPELPTSVRSAVANRMAEADPQANVHTTVGCADCAHTWRADFDIVSFFWTEIEAWAHRTLRQVHRLARAYGWTEDEILALSASRRQLYMHMIQA